MVHAGHHLRGVQGQGVTVDMRRRRRGRQQCRGDLAGHRDWSGSAAAAPRAPVGVLDDERGVGAVAAGLGCGQRRGPGAVGAHRRMYVLETAEVGTDEVEVHQLGLVGLECGDRFPVRGFDVAEPGCRRFPGGQRQDVTGVNVKPDDSPVRPFPVAAMPAMPDMP